ncbi:hypothetical protein CMUST_09760 [Corynebacterium mustelae]|uniref:AAA domain-containing protein n=1 Tax=Corynebacterium mustelae TaxID=571915 RepID=A0A0G3H382_9CORY|nr:MinD/ParA family protein [Corynebacterium mustelae]AKK06268.1 hypothetical protein CMUST_09760 [Corynebacterium mustelae]
MNQPPGNNGGHPAWLRIDADEAPEPQHAAQPNPPTSTPHSTTPHTATPQVATPAAPTPPAPASLAPESPTPATPYRNAAPAQQQPYQPQHQAELQPQQPSVPAPETTASSAVTPTVPTPQQPAVPRHRQSPQPEPQHSPPQPAPPVATPQKTPLESAALQPEPTPMQVQQPATPPPAASLPAEPANTATSPATASNGTPVKQPAAATHPPLTATKMPLEQFELVPPPALDQSNLVNPVKTPPKGGWRKFLHKITAGRFNPGDSAKQRKHDELLERINTPLRGDYRIAVMSLKGGVGKTTTTATLGGILAETRGDRVIAIDANPDLGTLAQRVVANNTATIRDLLALEDTTRYPEIRSYTTQAKSRLEVVGSERDPAVSEAFSEAEYRKVIDILRHHYNIVLTDCGTGLMHSTMNGVLDLANALILVTSPALDGAQSASATLDWLKLHGYEQLAANSVVVVSAAPLQRSSIDMDHLVKHFRSRTRAVQVIPYDPHLAEGATIDLNRIGKSTREAYLELAAIIAEDFNAWDRQPPQQ